MALTMPMLIVARVLQGIGGGGMQPLAQSILLESFPPRQHGTAMARLWRRRHCGPGHRPDHLADGSPTATPGAGFSTSIFPWACLALFMVNLYVEDPPYLRQAFQGAIDYLGFGLLALWLGSLQLVLDKGQEADWFAAPWVCWTAAISTAALVAFIIRELTDHEPIVQLRILLDRNFAVGTLITCTYGLCSLWRHGHAAPVFANPAGIFGVAKRPLGESTGIGSMASMIAVGLLVRYIDGRWLMCFGFGLLAASTWMLGQVNLQIGMSSVVLPNLVNGFAMGFIWVPLTP